MGREGEREGWRGEERERKGGRSEGGRRERKEGGKDQGEGGEEKVERGITHPLPSTHTAGDTEVLRGPCRDGSGQDSVGEHSPDTPDQRQP